MKSRMLDESKKKAPEVVKGPMYEVKQLWKHVLIQSKAIAIKKEKRSKELGLILSPILLLADKC